VAFRKTPWIPGFSESYRGRIRTHGCIGQLAPLLMVLLAGCSEPANQATAPTSGDSGVSGNPTQTYGGSTGNGGLPSAGRTALSSGGTGGSIKASGGKPGTGAGGVTGGSFAGASGAKSAAGAGPSAGGTSGGNPGGSCPLVKVNKYPFGCKLAWGTNDPGGSLASYSDLQFMSKWVPADVRQDGTIPSCDGCNWISSQVASTNLIPVYYAYFIGFFGHANGLPDQNVNPNGPNLASDGANLIRNNRSIIVDMYASYAKSTYQVWKSKPLVWLLEGDFIQYGDTGQKNPLSYVELAQITGDITCAIKTNMPNAVVAINHTTWNGNDETKDFWGAMKTAGVAYDMVWTTGVANKNGFMEDARTPDYYNYATATYAYVHQLTGLPILVDTSFGLSAAGNSWSTSDAATLNQRIAEGVIAVNVGELGGQASQYQSAVKTLAPKLNAVCSNP
jgi:hypothetical protein